MKPPQLPLLSFLLGSSNAFRITSFQAQPQRNVGRIFSTLDGTDSPSLDAKAITAVPREKLLDVAYGLKDDFGVFIIDKKGQEDLRSAVDDLESVSQRPIFDEDTKTTMLGTWTLVCTTSSSTSLPSPLGSGIDTTKLPFFNLSPLKDIRQTLNKCLVVQQVILAKDSEDIDRVDHVLEYQPPKTLQDILNTLPSLNINPLDVTKGKGILVHETDVTNTGPGFSIELKLSSIVLNVAGTSNYLDPNGEDVLGINSPFKEFQAGTFETTYLDEALRISRTTMGSVETLRVYVKNEEEQESDDVLDEEYFDEFDKFGSDEDEEESDDSDDIADAEMVEDDVSPSDY